MCWTWRLAHVLKRRADFLPYWSPEVAAALALAADGGTITVTLPVLPRNYRAFKIAPQD